MRIDILTLFPSMFTGPFDASIVARAAAAGLVEIAVHDLRRWTHDRHHTADDAPFGGGPGMVLKPEPIFEAVDEIAQPQAEIILLTPNGQPLTQPLLQDLAQRRQIVLICGHYEGVDERVAEALATCEVSIGDYVLSGGEIPAMVLVDGIVRLIPGALGCADSTREEAHTDGLLEYPQYTRPAVYRGMEVPEIVRAGDHQALAQWKRRQALLRTLQRRPDLLRPTHWEELRRRDLLAADEPGTEPTP
jgi:tRNA (guanine37-N1)-methyltransferase